MRWLAFVVVLGCATTAHAEGRDRETAQLLSGAGAGVSGALILGGFAFASEGNPTNKPLLYAGLASVVITPSLGQIYAGQYVTIGMGVRLAAGGLAWYALTHETKTIQCDNASTSGTMCTGYYGIGIAMLGIAAIAAVGGAAYDVNDAGAAADRYNARHGLYVAPATISTPTGPAPGLSVGGTW